MSNHEVFFMRFTGKTEKRSPLYLVGCSVEEMRKDALQFGDFTEGEVITHDDTAAAAEARNYPPRLFKNLVASAREGRVSAYLFG